MCIRDRNSTTVYDNETEVKEGDSSLKLKLKAQVRYLDTHQTGVVLLTQTPTKLSPMMSPSQPKLAKSS